MVSIQATGGPVPSAALRDAVDWTRVVVATLARGVVATLLGLALWAAAPAVIGWMPTSVMTGSMEPRLHPGDVVVSRPVAPVELRPGRILLADDPDQPGHLRMHRYVEDGRDDTLITKGDANPQADSTPLRRSAVHGVAFLRVPYVGSPVVWIRDGQWARVVVLALGVVGLLALCTIDGSLRRLAERTDDDADESDGAPTSGGHTDGRVWTRRGRAGSVGTAGREARHRAASGLPSDGAPVRVRATVRSLGDDHGPATVRRSARLHGRRAARRRGSRTRVAAVVLVLGLAAAGALVPASVDAAPWRGTTTRTGGTFTAATLPAPVVTCATGGTTLSKTAVLTWTGADNADSFDVIANTTVLKNVPGTVRTLTLGGGSGISLLGNSTVTVRANSVFGGTTTWTRTSNGVPVTTLAVSGVVSSAACGSSGQS